MFDSGLSIGGGRGRGPFIIIRGRWNHGMGNGVGGGYVPTCPRSTGHSVIFTVQQDLCIICGFQEDLCHTGGFKLGCVILNSLARCSLGELIGMAKKKNYVLMSGLCAQVQGQLGFMVACYRKLRDDFQAKPSRTGVEYICKC